MVCLETDTSSIPPSPTPPLKTWSRSILKSHISDTLASSNILNLPFDGASGLYDYGKDYKYINDPFFFPDKIGSKNTFLFDWKKSQTYQKEKIIH
jgi:hypothetical protein